ncbi:hypothetical protein N7501_008722 [Penicillium viridicatum]|nr:hypothetical protein N7501_008722 [Penicillium viridicatum]
MKTRDVTIHSIFLIYRKLLDVLLVARQKLKEYYEKTYRDHGFLYSTRILLAPYTELDRLLEPPSASIFYKGVEYNKKEHEREFLVLSRLARDLLLVPITGAGIERLFNSVRDICHYRRGSLYEGTI